MTPTTCHRFQLDALPRQPWKNGAGSTRELACHPPGAGLDHFDWRVSVADLVCDAPFSVFPGVRRTITLLSGPGLRLQGTAPDGPFNAELKDRWASVSFEGEWPLQATLLGGPSEDLNVMVRRRACRAEQALHHAALALPTQAALLLLALQGQWTVTGAQEGDWTLSPREGACWPHGVGAGARIFPAPGPSQLLCIAFLPVHAPD